TVHILAGKELDNRPFSKEEAAQRTRGSLLPQKAAMPDVEAAPSWKRERAAGWKESAQYVAGSSVADLPKQLMRTNFAYQELDEITLMGRVQLEMVIPSGPIAADTVPRQALSTADQALSTADDTAKVSLDADNTSVAVLALPRKLNGVTDVVVID